MAGLLKQAQLLGFAQEHGVVGGVDRNVDVIGDDLHAVAAGHTDDAVGVGSVHSLHPLGYGVVCRRILFLCHFLVCYGYVI